MKPIVLALLTSAGLSAAAVTAQPSWELFDQSGYRFRLEVPHHLFDHRNIDGDVVRWTSDDGEIRLEASAFLFGRGMPPSEVLTARQSLKPDRIVTYAASGDTWAVASGYETPDRRRVFYERFEAGRNGMWAGFVLRYDVTRRSDVDATINRLGRSLAVTD